MQLTTDISGLPIEVRRALVAKLQHADRARYDMAVIEQQQMANLFRQAAGPGCAKTGVGPLSLAINPYLYGLMQHRYGTGILQDPDFRKWLGKRHPEFASPDCATRIQVGYQGRPRK